VPDSLTRLQAALAERYAVQRELGHGGMATVYLAEDRRHHRAVAVKVLKPELAQAVGPERFLREIEISARLRHPHILPLYDSGEADRFLYYVMPYVEGESLRDRLNREKQLPLEDALRIAREVADALSYAHSHRVVHRDIKPENILLESDHAVVADFGIARAISAAGGAKLTATGLAIGTPVYMSPEQAAGSKDVDGRSDLYSLGCVLYEMLAGQPPFTGPTVESIVHQHLIAEPPNVTSRRPAVPGWVAAALERALAKTPADRFSPVALFAEALTPRESAAALLAPEALAPPREAPSRRVPRIAVAGVAAAVVLGGVMLIVRPGGRPPDPAYPRTAVAVLPFQNLSADPAHAYFAEGLHDELLTQLSKVAALSLRGRTSVMGYAGTTKSIRQIAEELAVGALVDGSVQVVAGRLRVNVKLIDAATDEHLWAETYDRTLDDAFAIQSDVAQRVVVAVGAALRGAERVALTDAPTENAEAYRFYLQGKEYFGRPGYLRENSQIAERLYERALALEPGFALARAALSRVHGRMYWWRYDLSPARVSRQRQEAEAALRLAPELPQAHIAMGLVHYYAHYEYRQALEHFTVALERMPNDGTLVSLVGAVHRRLGNWDEALAAFKKATELNPRDADLFYDLGGDTYLTLHRYGDAAHVLDRALALAPDLDGAAIWKAMTYVIGQGQLDSLRVALDRVPPDADVMGWGTARAVRAQLLHWERRTDSLIRVLSATPFEVFAAQELFLPVSLYAAWAHQLRGDTRAANAAFDTALALLDSAVDAQGADWRQRAARGLALAGLGRRAEALREAQWLRQSIVYREDALLGPRAAEARAKILAQAGDADAALDEIERLLAGPSLLSVHTLCLDPLWDPIREHPRFKDLLVTHAER
jgi:eukaryotic-like serine/threonine-protein kinase